jgi:hypothetical protein
MKKYKTMSNDNSKFDRREVLKASGLAVGIGTITNPVAGENDSKSGSPTEGRENPDMEVFNNSRSQESITIRLNNSSTGELVSTISISSKGMNHPDISGLPAEKAISKVKNDIGLPVSDFNGSMTIEASNTQDSDTTTLNVQDGKALPDVTAKIFIDPDGSVSTHCSISCGPD